MGLITEYENKRIRNFVNNIIKRAKNDYYKNRFQNNINDLKQTWRDLRKIVSANSNRRGISEIEYDERSITNSIDIARHFNDHFCSVANRVTDGLPVSDCDPMSYVRRNCETIVLDPVTVDEVIGVVQKLKNTKYDINSISVKALKHNICVLGLPVATLINMIFSQGIFPDVLKIARVTPIYKKGNEKDMNNYRPISILPLFSKIVEKCIKSRLEKFLNNNSLLSSTQYGFRRKLSTLDAIVSFSQYIVDNLEQFKHVIGIFIDYAKAFDTVNHEILLMKLEAYGIRGKCLSLMKSYLQNRLQYVKIGDSISNKLLLTSGVPQGSVLGPILFILYVNDFSNISTAVNTIQFADDTTVLASGADFEELYNLLSGEIVNIVKWSNCNRLALNAGKTSALIFTNRLHGVNLELLPKIDDVSVEYCNVVKFLGVEVDNKLKFKEHIKYIHKKLSRVIGVMYKVSKYLPLKAMIGLYYSLFYPYILYCNEIWGCTYSVHLNDIELLQKRVVRIITGSDFLANTGPLFYSTGILKIKDVNKFLLALYMRKNLDNFRNINSVYQTRNAIEPLIRNHRLTITEHSVYYSACRLWRELPNNLKCIDSLLSFKTELKKYFIHQYSNS